MKLKILISSFLSFFLEFFFLERYGQKGPKSILRPTEPPENEIRRSPRKKSNRKRNELDSSDDSDANEDVRRAVEPSPTTQPKGVLLF